MSGFLEDQIAGKRAELDGKSSEEAKKRAEGFVKVRALDPMDGNKTKVMWVKKDDLTVKYESEQAKEVNLDRKEQELAHKSKMLDLAKREKEIREKSDEIDAMEKKLLKENK